MSSSILPTTSALTSKQTTTLTNTTFTSNRALTIKTHTNQTHRFKVTCNLAQDDHHNHQKHILPDIDRRSLLVGLSGLYTTANFASLPAALADPITTPDITSICKEAESGIKDFEKAVRTRKCCPPNIKKPIKPFVFPTEKTVRVRWPAHNGTKEQVEKYKKAIQAMRDLPDDHPHSFLQQAKVHCAYCNGGYTQVDSGFPDIEIQIHNSWLFFPYHRWYLYFYERILGKLINDPTFALPYWNWDTPAGMTIPEIFLETDTSLPNPLFDIYRDARHLPPQTVDLDFGGGERDTTSEIQIACNLSTVYRDLVRNGADTKSFFGGEYVAGDAPVANGDKSVGSVEAGCHIAMHRWVGDPTQANFEDMGNLYSSGYDPLFYVHHSNVDRMWTLWKSLGIKGHTEPTDPDWLNASYVFYDENQDLVRVYNKDCVKMDKLKYKYYEETGTVFPWLKSRPARRSKNSQAASASGDVKTVDQLKFPVTLDRLLKVRVKRPAVNRTDTEKAKANEVLLINGIKFDGEKYVKFDVFVNDKVKEGEVTTPCDPEYAGGFAQIPHSGMNKMFMSSAARFGLTELLEDTNTEGEEYAVVALVPRVGCDDLTISDIKIELVTI